MALDFSDIFAKYEKLVASVDGVFQRVREQCGDAVACRPGCSDCCNAVFDLSIVEALYINHKFNQTLQGLERQAVLDRADEAERKQIKLAKKAFKRSESGVQAEDILEDVAKKRIRCPMLGANDTCVLYDIRPITCRLYGIPLAIGGQAHTCGMSGFEPGKPYPTVNMERIQDALVELGQELVDSLNTKFKAMTTMHIPLATALMTKFDEEYLGKDTAVVEAMHADPFAMAQAGEQAEARPAASGIKPMAEAQDGDCSGCEKSDCTGCASSGPGGCKGSPTIIELGGK
ncbi:YkgJ family cysteine cluster protein [Desulfocurvibacter africanus]|uniref:YkgJ family cysteine cluster protein n=1 Tax=Desulfocurvibacter africanus TaxID=873 RepID=UPI0003F74EFE|nr:YkgJ family cysteine cluster protein [Desulfocurvibacter africanus]